MNGKAPRHPSENKQGKWMGVLIVLLFLLGTGLFSFLWNMPLNTLRPTPSVTIPSTILVRPDSPESQPKVLDPTLMASVQPFLEHYVENITNAGHLDFSSHIPPEVEIRMEGLVIGLSPSLAVFNFRSKYGFSVQTSRNPNASDRAIYQLLKNRGNKKIWAPSTNKKTPQLSNPASSRKSCRTTDPPARGDTDPTPDDNPIQHL